MANKAYKFRIYPTKQQRVLIAKTFGCVRKVYNLFLGERINTYKESGERLTYSKCSEKLTKIKQSEEYAYLNEVDSIALQQSLRHLDTAFRNFFNRPECGFPKFKSKKSTKHSYSTTMVNGNISLYAGMLKLPKLGHIKTKQSRYVPSEYKLTSVTISQTPSGKYYASVLFEYENQVQKVQKPEAFLGLDYSMHELYKDSNGNEPQYPRYYRQAEKKLKKAQRKLSLMKIGSKNRDKQRKKVAKIHEKIANQRKDFLHKQSRQIVNAYDCVCIEDLNMRAMSQSLNFGKSVFDNGWGMFTTFLEYKLTQQGKRLIKIDKFFASSQLCSNCGYKNAETKSLSVREWTCPECGAHHDRDTNAAINIKNEGIWISRSCCTYVDRKVKSIVISPSACAECGKQHSMAVNLAS